MKILNLTQHPATPDQVAAGVVEPADKASVQSMLTFEEIPSVEQMRSRAEGLTRSAAIAGYEAAMVGGAPFFMAPLEDALRKQGIKPLYAFSKRESVEEKQSDGSVKKSAVFKHVGFVETS